MVSEEDLSFLSNPLNNNNNSNNKLHQLPPSPVKLLDSYLFPYKSTLTVTRSLMLTVTQFQLEEDKLLSSRLKFLPVTSILECWILRDIGCWVNWNGGSRLTTCAEIFSYGQRCDKRLS